MCADAPERVYGMAQTAVLDVDSAIADFQEAKDMGMVGMMMPGDPIHEDYDHPDYDALWECATDLQLPIAFHILTSRAGSLTAETRGHKMNNFLGIIRAIQDVVGLMVLGGVFERHPNLKLVVAESDAGWLPHYMYRMDHAARMNAEGGIIKGLSKLPSEYIRANVYATFQDDETAYHAVEHFPYEHLLWASDFPHTDSTWPRSRQLIAEQAAHLDEAQHQAIFRDNTAAPVQPAGRRALVADGGRSRRRLTRSPSADAEDREAGHDGGDLGVGRVHVQAIEELADLPGPRLEVGPDDHRLGLVGQLIGGEGLGAPADHLQSLVHQRARVDRDLRTHLPGRMGQCLVDTDVRQLAACGPGTDHRSPSAGSGRPRGRFDRRPQALVHRAVLAVNRHELGARGRPQRLHHRPGGDQALLVGQGEPLAGAQRGDGDRPARRSRRRR